MAPTTCFRCLTLPRSPKGSYCVACQRDLLEESHQSHPCVQAVIAAKSRPCVDCTRQYPPYVMDLDHVRGVKLFGLSAVRALATKPLAIVLEEIAKCDPRCANCHRERHYTARRIPDDGRDPEAIRQWEASRELRRLRGV